MNKAEVVEEVIRRIKLAGMSKGAEAKAIQAARGVVRGSGRRTRVKVPVDILLMQDAHPGCPHHGRNPGEPHPDVPCPHDPPKGVNVWINHCRRVVTIPGERGAICSDPFGRSWGIGQPEEGSALWRTMEHRARGG